MSTRVITWKGTPIGVTAVTIGVTRTDTSAVVVAAATAMALVSAGVYNYSFTEPAPSLIYSVTINWTFVNGTADSISYLTVGVTASTGYYASQTDLEAYFGTTMIAEWANVDGQTGPANSAMVVAALLYADAKINAFFAGSKYIVPMVTGAISKPLVTAWAVMIAGERLYHNRGQQTENAKDNQYTNGLDRVMSDMGEVRRSSSNQLVDALRTSSPAPMVIGFDSGTGLVTSTSSSGRLWYGNMIGWW